MKINTLPNPPSLHSSSIWALTLFTGIFLGACKKKSPTLSDITPEFHPPASSSPQKKALAQFDKNKDGLLSKSERNKMNQDFIKHFDTDGDKKLSAKEKAIARRRSKIAVVPSHPRAFTKKGAAAFLSRFDTNGDGKVSAIEAGETRWKVMQRSDTNKDGLISSLEWFAANLKRQKMRNRSKIPAAKTQ